MSEILKNTDTHTQPSFSLKNRFMRLMWNCTYTLLFKLSPRPLYGWRIFLLRCFGAKLGRGCHIYPKAKIWAPWNLSCADYVGIADDVIIYNQAPIVIGEKAVISQGAYLCTGSHDYENPRFPLFAKPIHIESYVWIAAEAFVMPGVTIGEGTVVGARSVVTKDIPGWTVCAGNPCRLIKPRKQTSDMRHETSD